MQNCVTINKMCGLFRDYKELVVRYWEKSKPLSKRYHIPTVIFFIDRWWSRFVYGADGGMYDWFEFYRLNHCARKELYTDGRYKTTVKWFSTKKAGDMLDSKRGFMTNFKEFHKRDFILLPCEKHELLRFSKKYDSIFIKTDDGRCGMNIEVISYADLVNDSAVLKRVSEINGVAEQPIVQHHEMAKLNKTAVSTIRIVTMIEKSGSINVLVAGLKIGKKGSFVDNISSGGSCCLIDLNSGVVIGYARDSSLNKYLFAGDQHITIPGFKIPYWNDIVKLVKDAAKVCPDARFVGWDVAVCENGPVLVEANISTGANVFNPSDFGYWTYLKEQRK